MKNRVCREIVFFIITNFLFYNLNKPIQNIVKKDFYTYGFITVKSVSVISAIILLATMGIIFEKILFIKKYKKLGLLSLFNIITTVFWIVLLVSTMDYSLSWNRFHTAEEVIISSFYILPVAFMSVTLIYELKKKTNK